MSCKSGLYASNTNTQVIAAGGIVNFGSVVRRYGCNANLQNGNVITHGSGYYNVDVNLSINGTTAGTLTLSLLRDGVPVQGAEANLSVVADTVYSVTIPAIIRNACDCSSTLTVALSGIGATINNAAIVVEKM